jgi:glycosyltransferase involved in cell wall biosynthesis
MRITACLIIKNEEKYLQRCLESIVEHVDEIIITDTGSTDHSIKIAKNFTNNIHHFEWCNDFSQARNYCQTFATGDYIL